MQARELRCRQAPWTPAAKDAPFGNIMMQMQHNVEQEVLRLASRLVVAAVTINCNGEKMSNFVLPVFSSHSLSLLIVNHQNDENRTDQFLVCCSDCPRLHSAPLGEVKLCVVQELARVDFTLETLRVALPVETSPGVSPQRRKSFRPIFFLGLP